MSNSSFRCEFTDTNSAFKDYNVSESNDSIICKVNTESIKDTAGREITSPSEPENAREPPSLSDVDAYDAAAPHTSTPTRRILRSGSTFGQTTISETESKRSRQTHHRRQPLSVRKDDNRKWPDSEKTLVKDSVYEPEGNGSRSCRLVKGCDNNDNNHNCDTSRNKISGSHIVCEEKRKNDIVLKTSTQEHNRQSTHRSKTTTERLKQVHADDNHPVPGQSKGKVKSDRLMSLLRSTDIQVNTSAPATLVASSASPSSSLSSSSSSSPSSSSPPSTSLASERRKPDKDGIAMKSPARHHKASSLLAPQATIPRSVDFTQVQPIPDETFFVSLSKDKKELSMLTTTKGTVRVNNVISKNHSEIAQPSTFYNDNAMKSSSHHESKRRGGDKNILRSVLSPNLSGHPSTVSHSGSCNTSQVDNEILIFSKDDILNKPIVSDQVVKNFVREHCTNDALDETSPVQTSAETIHDQNSVTGICIPSKNDGSAMNIATLPQKTSHCTTESLSKDSPDKRHKGVKKASSRPVSQFPLMEEILTDQSYHPFDKKDVISKVSETNSVSNSSQVFRLPASTSNTTSSSTTLLPVDCALSNSKHIKRSERIRCKTGVDHESVSPLSSSRQSQSVISTMKPINKNNLKCKDAVAAPNKQLFKKTPRTSEEKPSLLPSTTTDFSSTASTFLSPSSLTPKLDYKMSSSKDISSAGKKKKKKKDKVCKPFVEDASEKKVPKKGKDFSKAKASMSREVMDGIVRSIEETVSRIRESADKEELESLSAGASARSSSTVKGEYKSVNGAEPIPAANISNIANSSQVKDKNTSGKISLKEMTIVRKKTSISKLYKSKSLKSARKRAMQQSKSKMDGLAGLKLNKNQTADSNNDNDDVETGSNDADSTVATGKRFRKKTRKAEEALGDYDIFWDEEWPVKKPKARRRHSINSSIQETAAKIGQRRSRRGLEQETISSDPVLEEHAFILWASEHRSELELKFPNVSTSELDALLSAKWCDVTSLLKTKYFCRAKEAFSDDDRQRIWSNHSSYGDLDSDVLCGFIMDRDPVFSDFVRMPVHRQRDLLRKWLKFFQKMMPRKEYVEFIVSFKRACGRDDIVTKSGKPKRTHMRSIDPDHYKILFDLIRLSKPRVLEVYKERRGKEKTMMSNTYSLMLKHLVNNQPWPHMDPVCQSYLLTELFQDLEELDREWEKEAEEEKRRKEETEKAEAGKAAKEKEAVVKEEEEERIGKLQQVTVAHDNLPLHSTAVKDSDHSSYFRQPNAGVEMDVDGDWGDVCDLNDVLDDDDLAVLETSCAQSCLSELEQLTDLPLLGQHILDEVFLTSTVVGVSSSQMKFNLINNNIKDCSDQSTAMKLNGSASHRELTYPSVTHHNTIFCSTNGLPFIETSMCPSVNTRYHTSVVTTPGRFIQNPPTSPYPTTIVSYKGNQCQSREGRIVKSRPPRGRSDPKTLVGYRGAMDSVIRYPSHAMESSPSMRCIRVRSSRQLSASQQLKMPFRPYQLPTGVHHRSSLPRNASQEMYLTANSAYTNKIPVEMSYRPRIFNSSTHFPLDSNSSRSASPGHLVHHRSSNSRTHTLHHHGNSSPLITSLSSLRTIKSRASNINYQAQQSCQMIPYSRSKLLCSSGSHQGSHTGYRRNSHSLPIGAAGSKLPGTYIQNSSLQQQIKVCLPSQALKIPIAKLKGTRKATTPFVRNRLKTPTVSFCNPDINFDPPPPHLVHELTARPTSSENQSVLARVLSCQENDENEPLRSANSGGFYSSLSSVHSSPCIRSYMSPLRQVKDNVSIISTESRMDSKVQLISIIGNNINNKNRYNYINSTMKTTTAASSSGGNNNNNLHHRCPGMSRLSTCHNNTGNLNVVRTTVKTIPIPLSTSSEHAPLTCLRSATSGHENIASVIENAFSTMTAPTKDRTVGDRSSMRSICNINMDSTENQPLQIPDKFISSEIQDNCTKMEQSSINALQPNLNIATSSSSIQMSSAVSPPQSVSLLLSPSQTLSHLLSMDSSVPEGTERCTCAACLSFKNKKKMPKRESVTTQSNNLFKENNGFAANVSKANSLEVTSQDCGNNIIQTQLTPSSVLGESETVSSLYHAEEANDSDDGREIKSISLHDAWDITLSNSTSTHTTTSVNRISTPEFTQPQSDLSSTTTISSMFALPRSSAYSIDSLPGRGGTSTHPVNESLNLSEVSNELPI